MTSAAGTTDLAPALPLRAGTVVALSQDRPAMPLRACLRHVADGADPGRRVDRADAPVAGVDARETPGDRPHRTDPARRVRRLPRPSWARATARSGALLLRFDPGGGNAWPCARSARRIAQTGRRRRRPPTPLAGIPVASRSRASPRYVRARAPRRRSRRRAARRVCDVDAAARSLIVASNDRATTSPASLTYRCRRRSSLARGGPIMVDASWRCDLLVLEDAKGRRRLSQPLAALSRPPGARNWLKAAAASRLDPSSVPAPSLDPRLVAGRRRADRSPWRHRRVRMLRPGDRARVARDARTHRRADADRDPGRVRRRRCSAGAVINLAAAAGMYRSAVARPTTARRASPGRPLPAFRRSRAKQDPASRPSSPPSSREPRRLLRRRRRPGDATSRRTELPVRTPRRAGGHRSDRLPAALRRPARRHPHWPWAGVYDPPRATRGRCASCRRAGTSPVPSPRWTWPSGPTTPPPTSAELCVIVALAKDQRQRTIASTTTHRSTPSVHCRIAASASTARGRSPSNAPLALRSGTAPRRR